MLHSYFFGLNCIDVSMTIKQSVKELKYNYSLEHILPQKWEEYWISVPVVDKDSKQISDSNELKRTLF